MIKYFFIILKLFKIVYGSLCVYNNYGTLKFDKLNIEDYDYVYSKYDFFFENPFNTYFSNCTKDAYLFNIFGVGAKRDVVYRNSTKIKRDENEMKKKLDLENGRTCNLLTSKNPEGNPYHEELTGIPKSPNFIKGWKYMDYTNQYISSGGSTSISYTVSFDQSFSISLQESHSSNTAYTIEKHSDDTSSKNFSQTISEMVEEALSTSMSEDNIENWEENIMNDITKINEKHTENTWNHEVNENSTTGSHSDSDEGSTSNQSSDSGCSSGTSSENGRIINGGISLGIPFFSGDLGGQDTESKSSNYEVNKSTHKDRGKTKSKSTGTNHDYSRGKSDSTGSSKGESDSVSESESVTRSNGGSRSVMNSIERSKSTTRGNDKTESTDIGHTTGESESTTNGTEDSKGTTVDVASSKSISYTIADTINNNSNGPCQIMLYKKIIRYIQISSCYDYNKETKNNINTRSIVNIDIDDKAIRGMMKNKPELSLYEEEDYKSLLLECKENTEEYNFIPEENEFTKLYESLRPTYPMTLNHDQFLESGQKLTSISSLGGQYVNAHTMELKMSNNNLIFSKGDVEIFNTNTTYTKSGEAYFKISNLNHLEILTENQMFKPVGIYGEEFKDVNYMDDPNLPDFTKYKINPDPKDQPKKPNNEDLFMDHLKRDQIDITYLFSQTEEYCKYTLWYCNCQNPNNPYGKNCLNEKLPIRKQKELYWTFVDELRDHKICTNSKIRNTLNYSEDEINQICDKKTQEMDLVGVNILNDVNCSNYEQCLIMIDSALAEIYIEYKNLDCELIIYQCRNKNNNENNTKQDNEKESKNNSIKETNESVFSRNTSSVINEKIDKYIKELTDNSKFKIDNVVLWSNIKPEHQHLIVGWNGNGLNKNSDTSYLVISTFDQKKPSSTYDGLTLYDSLGIPIWRYKKNGDDRSPYLDHDGYYLPVKYGYPFKDEEVSKNIPYNYLFNSVTHEPKNNPHLQMPKGITYKGNFLYFGGCNNTIYSNEGLKSENGRFSLILNGNGNLIFKDHYVTIWESKTANMWQGKAPYKLIVGRDGVMRILNKFDYLIMSTINREEKDNMHVYKRYRLEVLNAGTFRIVNENGEEVWNMWNHAINHEFYIYNEHEFYDACEAEVRNPNLPLITTYNINKTSNFDNSIIRVGEQLINRFTEIEYEDLKRSDPYKLILEKNQSFNFNTDDTDFILDLNNNYYSTAVLPLTSFHLKYQNLLQKFENVDDKNIVIGDSYIDLKPITDRNSRIVYGKLNQNGVFNIYDCKDHVLFTTGIEGETCTDSNICFYFMYITPDTHGYVKIMKRKYKDNLDKTNYEDSLIWIFPPDKKMTEMRSDQEKHFLQNLESLIYRTDNNIDKDCEKSNNDKKEIENKLKKDNFNYQFLSTKSEEYCKDAFWYYLCKSESDAKRDECRKKHVKIKENGMKYENFKKELENNKVYHHEFSNTYTEDDINLICSRNNCQDKIINEFPCITLRTKGVYFYGNKTPFFEYDITTDSKLRLDKNTGYLTLDGQNILDLDDELDLPTRIKCNINNDKYGIILLNRKNSVVWEYPSSIYYSLTNLENENSIIVDRSIYYLNDSNENIPCINFKSDGLYNSKNVRFTKEYNKNIKGRTLYLDAQQLYIQDINDNIIPESVIRLYNPEKHHVSLFCKDENSIVVVDKVNNNTIWSYPSQQYTSLSSNTDHNKLYPLQELIFEDDESNNKFCLKIDNDSIINIDLDLPILKSSPIEKTTTEYDDDDDDDTQSKKNTIEFLDVTENGVFVHFKNGTSTNLVNNVNENINNANTDMSNTNIITNQKVKDASSKQESVYSIKCDFHYGTLKAIIYHNNEMVMTLPPYEKKYEISSTDYLYYGEILYNKENDQKCLIFDDKELHAINNNQNITIYKIENFDKNEMPKFDVKNYIKIKNQSLYFNDNVEIQKIKEISGNVEIIGKCLNYHGSNKFVLYNPTNDIVYVEYPTVEKKTSLQNDDVIYDMIYVDNKFKAPCIRIDEIHDDEGLVVTDSNGNKQIGLFFSTYNTPIPLDTEIYDIPNNNNLKFDQKEGKLLLNGKNVFRESFSKNLILKCKYEPDNTMISTETEFDEQSGLYIPEYLHVKEYLYTSTNEECFKLTENGIQFNYNKHTYFESGTSGQISNKLRYIYIEKIEGFFKIVFMKDQNNSDSIMIPNKAKANHAELRCDLEYGYYVKDSKGNRLKNMIPRNYTSENLFTNNNILYVGDKIISDDETVCGEIDKNFKFLSYDNVYSLQLNINDMSAPLVINGNHVFSNIPKEYIDKPPKSISLRCHQIEEYTFLALYDDDNNAIIDEVFDKCRKHKDYMTNENYNNAICVGKENSLIDGDNKCLSYVKKSGSEIGNSKNKDEYQLLDINERVIYTNELKSDKIYLDKETGNLMTSNRQLTRTLLTIENNNVMMKCSNKDEILLLDREDNDRIIWMYRPYAEDQCNNGLESKSTNGLCNTIYKFEKMGEFKIDASSFGRFYDEDIISLKITNNGLLVANENEIIIEDEWNLNRFYNYGIKCQGNENNLHLNYDENDPNSNCRFINLDTKECKNAGFVLTNEGFKYRSIDEDNNKNEVLFKGEIPFYGIGGLRSISYAQFDKDYNFIVQYKDNSNTPSDTITIVPYENLFESRDTENNKNKNLLNSGFNKEVIIKDVGITCSEGRLQFYENYNDETKIYYEYPPRTPDKIKKVYIYEKDTNRCLYVNERDKENPIKTNSLCKGDSFLWEIPYSGKGIWKNVGSGTYISSNKNGIIYTSSDIMNSVLMKDITKFDNSKPFSLGCFRTWRSTKYEADAAMKNDECNIYGDANRWILSETSPVKTKKVFIINSVTKGCLYAVGKSSNEVKIDSKCNGNSYLWEIPESGNSGVWKNVETGYYLTKSSDNKLMVTSYFYDSNVLRMADISKSDYKFWIQDFEKGCLYPTNELQKCDSSNSKHKWIISQNKPSLADTQKIYIIFYKDSYRCLSVNKYGNLSIELAKTCNGKEFIWEISETGYGVLRNVGTGKYLIMNSNKSISVSSDSSHPNIALISKNENFGICINNNNDECLYIDDNYNVRYDTCNKNNNNGKLFISYISPEFYSIFTFQSSYDKGHGEYLSVSSISNIDKIKLSSSNKYYSWIISTNDDTPSTWYLSDGQNGKYGPKTGYCLDVNLSKSSSYNRYLMLVPCGKAKAKFKYGGHYPINIYAYYDDKVKCIDFDDSMYPKVRDCEDASPSGNTSLGWKNKLIIKAMGYEKNPI
ncbi:hypothetical protein PIROE2DRAFT_18010 [Piromyces sp. E2]|nr:hypothetical protein PIROE2DRAFT_18010 [Piromyces sp. E2]|eukprot:OUM57105.1 hypothetical protein PIROE2DRAFT_18010 [Piromyces sp. E2]